MYYDENPLIGWGIFAWNILWRQFRASYSLDPRNIS